MESYLCCKGDTWIVGLCKSGKITCVVLCVKTYLFIGAVCLLKGEKQVPNGMIER